VTVAAGGVTPAEVQLSSGAYEFAGGVVSAGVWTVSGGELGWADTGVLGTNAIDVTGNAAIRSTKTSAAAYMRNSAINLADGVTLHIYQHNPNNKNAAEPTVAPITGGSTSGPATVVMHHAISQGRVRLSPSTFVGSYTNRNRVTGVSP
jgi:hypothetical protein